MIVTANKYCKLNSEMITKDDLKKVVIPVIFDM